MGLKEWQNHVDAMQDALDALRAKLHKRISAVVKGAYKTYLAQKQVTAFREAAQVICAKTRCFVAKRHMVRCWAAARIIDFVEEFSEGNRVGEDGFALLNVAAQEGHADICKFLLESRADVDRVNNNGLTPLLFSVQRGHAAFCRLLVELGAEVDRVDNESCTPLYTAAQQGHTDICIFFGKSR